jgi:Insertion element 4 transposase N-terminal
VTEKDAGTAVPGAASLPDRVALGVLTRLVTRELVDGVLAGTGRAEQRKRLLPARVVVYFVLALALFYGDSYEEVMRKLVQGLSWLSVWKKEWHVPTSSALAQARERLGPEPLRELFERAAVPWAQLSTAGAWLCGRRLMSLDGVEMHAADTPANSGYFGRKSGKDGTGAFPLVLVMALALAECGTHAVTAAEAGPVTAGEVPLAVALASAPGNLEPGMLVLADRGLYGYEVITAVTSAGAAFCVRVTANLDLPVLEWLPDGSYRSYIPDPKIRNLTSVKSRLASGALAPDAMPGIPVRVVDYDVLGRGGGEIFTVVTNILDYQDMTAADLAAAYHERWVRHEVAWSEWSSQKEDRLMLVT